MTTIVRTCIVLLLAAGLAGCDSDPNADDAGMTADGGDAGAEQVAPTVLSTIPADGDVEVDPSAVVRVVFSEPVEASSGTVELTAGGESVTADHALSDDGRELRITPASALPGNASVEVVVGGFADLAGNAMAGEHAFTFTTADPFAPTVVSATPAEGAGDVSPATTALEIEFSEAMNATLGVAALEGGPGAIGAPTWEGARASFALSGLAPDTAYRVVLTGFADPAGNALDGAPYLTDGALDFTTGADASAPVVTEATPGEGETGVVPGRVTRMRIIFDEPMDTGAGAAVLEQGASSTPLEASWAGGGTILLLGATGLLEPDLPHRVTLTGFTDAAGNALDGGPYLGDGALDFSTGGDEPAPFVLYTNPAEGSTGLHWSTDTLFVTFSEVMDTSVTEVPFSDGVSSDTFAGAWSSGGTLLELDLAGRLISGRTYELDFTAFHDAEGTALDPAHAYLGDGHLSFTTAPPKGENCQDFLTAADATVADGVHTWTIGRDQVQNVDGAAPCDASGGSADVVVRYTKTTPDSADAGGAGRVLRVTVTSGSSSLNVDVLRDACDPTSSAGARLSCVTDADEPYSFDLDVGPGDYYVWVAAATYSFRDTTITIEEIPAGVGDTCRNAIPITAGTTAITPTGAQRLDAPSCTGDSPLTWYRYTAGQRLGLVTLDAARAIAGMDATHEQPLHCRASAVTTPMPVVVEPGDEVCIAVASGDPATITIEEMAYTGVAGVPTDLGVTYPDGVWGPYYAPYIGVTPSRIYVSGGSDILYAPRTGGVEVVEYTPPSAHPVPGDHGVTIGEVLYSLSSSGPDAAEPEPMVLQVTDSTGAFLDPPVPVDTAYPYVDGPSMAAIVVDGTNFLIAQDTSSDVAVTYFYSVPIAGGPATQVGSNNYLESVSALAVDSTYIYVISRTADGGEASEGIYRLRRDQLTDPTALPELVYSGGHNWSNGTGGLFLDSMPGMSWLYFRTYGPSHVHLLLNPDGATPRYLGPIYEQTRNNETGLGYDPTNEVLYVIDRDHDDAWVRLD